MHDVVIRRATREDAEDIARIYNSYIRDSTATFDTVTKTVEDRKHWLDSRDDSHPVFVATQSGETIGFASVSAYRDRPAWAHTVEAGVYLDMEATGRGVGPLLLAEVITAARNVGHHVMVSQIVSENRPSIVMTQRAGFEHVGTLREVGKKFGRWLDVEIMQLRLDEGAVDAG